MKIVTNIEDGASPVHVIDTAGLCELIGVSPATLSDLKRRGIAVHIGRGAYDLGATVAAYCASLREVASGRGGEDHVLRLTAERARLAAAQANAVERKNAAADGELVAAGEVVREWSDILRKIRSQFLAVPSRLRQSLPVLTAADVVRIDRELRDVLQGLGHDDD